MRAFIAEDQILVRRGIEQMLTANGVEVVGTAEDARGLVGAVLDSGADRALLDIRCHPRRQMKASGPAWSCGVRVQDCPRRSRR